MKKIKILGIILFIILIITIIIMVIISFSTHKSVGFNDIFNYKLGDVVDYEKYNNYFYNNWVKYYFYGTIASDYRFRTNKNSDYDILYQIMKEKSNGYEIPNDDELIIHLRIGDVIDWEYNDSIDDLLEGRKKYFYLISYDYLDKMSKQIIDMDIEKIILVGGYHTKEDHSRSEEYVAKIKKYIEDKGFKVTTRIDKGSGDEDFIYMSNSKYFLKSGGGYSNLINRMVKMNNGLALEIK